MHKNAAPTDSKGYCQISPMASIDSNHNNTSKIPSLKDHDLLSAPWMKFSALMILFVVVFIKPISFTVHGWFTTSLSYGFLIFCMSLYIIWSQRDVLKNKNYGKNNHGRIAVPEDSKSKPNR